MPVSAVKLGMSSLAAMGAAVTAFGVSTPSEQGSPHHRVVIDKLVVPSSSGLALVSVQRSFVVREGEGIERILLRGGAVDGEFMEFIAANDSTRRLFELQPGEQFHARIDSIGRVHELRYSLGQEELNLETREGKRLVIRRSTVGLKATIETISLIRSSRIGYSRIVSNLFSATHGAGIPEKIASQIVDVLGGELNFQRDVRRGDELRVIYETLTEPDRLDVEYAGRLLAVELKGRKKAYSALWLEEANGSGQYYDFKGHASRSFLRYPIEYARISSGFKRARWHPVLAKRMAHRGVDFAAKRGTRIRASGNGMVEFVGTQRGYGRVVRLKHRGRIQTLYAHMSRFRKGLRKGNRVRQGDVIGYVGSSGWATGAHLHYEFRVSGRHKNPLTIKLPKAKNLTADLRDRHGARAAQLRAQLDQIETIQIAGRFE